MKNIATLIIAVLISTATVKAYVWTVSNNAFSPGHFTNLQIAIDSASTGDSIYVEPSPNDYGSISIPKKLYIFGGGAEPRTYQLNTFTEVDAVTFTNQSLPPTTSSGSLFTGFYSSGGITVNAGLSNISVMRNELNGSFQISGVDSNIVLANNIFDGGNQVYIGSSYNNDNTALITNNFFNGTTGNYGEGAVFEISGNQQSGIQVLNNIVYSTAQNASYGSFFRYINAATVKNNVFYCFDPNGTFSSGCANCVMDNNITFSDGLLSTENLPDAGNSGSNNYNNVGANPFAGAIPVFTVISAYNLATYNWNVINTYSTAGSDGTPIGIYGGAYPMPGFETITRLPQVRQVNINNTSVQPGGTLNVNIIGTTHN